MAQGTTKLKANPAAAGKRKPTVLGPKKGKRVIAPKKIVLANAAAIQKRTTSGIINQTEKSLASKAGHLELLKGGKKDRKEKRAAKEAGKA